MAGMLWCEAAPGGASRSVDAIYICICTFTSSLRDQMLVLELDSNSRLMHLRPAESAK